MDTQSSSSENKYTYPTNTLSDQALDQQEVLVGENSANHLVMATDEPQAQNQEPEKQSNLEPTLQVETTFNLPHTLTDKPSSPAQTQSEPHSGSQPELEPLTLVTLEAKVAKKDRELKRLRAELSRVTREKVELKQEVVGPFLANVVWYVDYQDGLDELLACILPGVSLSSSLLRIQLIKIRQVRRDDSMISERMLLDRVSPKNQRG
jgi:hypothetical protein